MSEKPSYIVHQCYGNFWTGNRLCDALDVADKNGGNVYERLGGDALTQRRIIELEKESLQLKNLVREMFSCVEDSGDIIHYKAKYPWLEEK